MKFIASYSSKICKFVKGFKINIIKHIEKKGKTDAFNKINILLCRFEHSIFLKSQYSEILRLNIFICAV